MKTYTFDDIRKNGLLLYEYIRGSQAYGTNTPESDEDHGGVYLEPSDQLIGLGLDFQDEIKSEKHDDLWYSLKKYMSLLLASNPSVLESLFIDDSCVIYEHPIITEIKKHRQEFVTKACFKSFTGYAIAQIKRAKGLNKLCNWKEVKRANLLNFCYTPFGDGSQQIKDWLDKHGLKQRYCGLSAINNMPGCYNLFYDWGNHILNEHVGFYRDESNARFLDSIEEFLLHGDTLNKGTWDTYIMLQHRPIGYRGIITESEIETADDVRCSSIPKGEVSLCLMTCNKDGYKHHCIEYKQWTTWNKNKNEERYQSNLGYNYDSKNMMHCFRLAHMGLEIAKTGKVNINRKDIDRDFLMDIRNHKYDYEYLISHLEELKKELDDAISASTLPEQIDPEVVNNLLLSIRKKYQFPNKADLDEMIADDIDKAREEGYNAGLDDGTSEMKTFLALADNVKDFRRWLENAPEGTPMHTVLHQFEELI